MSGAPDDFEKILLEIRKALAHEFGEIDWFERPFAEVYPFLKGYLAKRQWDRKPPGVKVVIAGVKSGGTTFLETVDLDGTSWEGDVLCTDPEHIKVDELHQVVGRSRDEVLAAISRVWRGQKVVHILARGDIELFESVGERVRDCLSIPGVESEYM